MAFTGPYVNAVLAGQSRFGAAADTLLQNGSYSRVVSVVVTDGNGNPTNPNTQVNFYLIDGPITGYPNIPGNFVIAGSDGTLQASGVNFSAADGQFLERDVHPLDRLVLSGGKLRTADRDQPEQPEHSGEPAFQRRQPWPNTVCDRAGHERHDSVAVIHQSEWCSRHSGDLSGDPGGADRDPGGLHRG